MYSMAKSFYDKILLFLSMKIIASNPGNVYNKARKFHRETERKGKNGVYKNGRALRGLRR
jgi:hypothetical protein